MDLDLDLDLVVLIIIRRKGLEISTNHWKKYAILISAPVSRICSGIQALYPTAMISTMPISISILISILILLDRDRDLEVLEIQTASLQQTSSQFKEKTPI